MDKDLIKIWTANVLSATADYMTTKIGLTYPELYEMNPFFDPKKEVLWGGVGGTGLLIMGKALKVDERAVSILTMIPASMPLIAAVNNLAWITYAHRKYYPWKECPFLYPE